MAALIIWLIKSWEVFDMISNETIKYIQNHRVWNKLSVSDFDKNLIIESVISKFDKCQFDAFINNSYRLLSQNIYIENLIFSIMYQELNYNNFNFNDTVDLKSIIATSNSLIQRPDIEKPSEVVEEFREPDLENDFIRIARFERQLIKNDYRGYSEMAVLFEGLLPSKNKENPLSDRSPSQYIWDDKFYYGLPVIQGLCFQIDSLNFPHILWVNSQLLEILKLNLDNYHNGLQAINSNQEIIIKFRCWREKLIGNGYHGNIPFLEGGDLLIRKDYYDELKKFIPSIAFYSYLIKN